MSTAKHTLRARLTRLAIAVSIGIVLAVLSAEFGLRFFLFHSSSFAVAHGQRFRDVGFFGDRQSDDEVWKLEWLMNDAGRLHDAPNADAKHGWLDTIERSTYRHPGESRIASRRPVLLYGDSFAHGNTPPEQSFQSLVERSELAKQHALLNFGVGGYGLDQTWLLLRESIDHYAPLDPIVAIGVFVDDDIDRCVLSFRCWPKPRFTLVGDELRDPEPVTTDIHAYLEEHPLGIRSYLWRFLKYRRRVLPQRLQFFLRDEERRIDEKQAIARAILTAMHRDLTARHIQHFVLEFHGENTLIGNGTRDWQEAFLERTCRELDIPLVSTRPYFAAASRGDTTKLRSFFGGSPQLYGHYNVTGNLVAFEALRAGIESRFGEADVSRAAKIPEVGGASVLLPITKPSTLFGHAVEVRTLREEECVRVVDESAARGAYVRGTDLGPTAITIALDGALNTFDARLEWAKPHRECTAGWSRVVVSLDGRNVFDEKVEVEKGAKSAHIDVSNAKSLTISVWAPHDEAECGWVRFVDARLD